MKEGVQSGKKIPDWKEKTLPDGNLSGKIPDKQFSR